MMRAGRDYIIKESPRDKPGFWRRLFRRGQKTAPTKPKDKAAEAKPMPTETSDAR